MIRYFKFGGVVFFWIYAALVAAGSLIIAGVALFPLISVYLADSLFDLFHGIAETWHFYGVIVDCAPLIGLFLFLLIMLLCLPLLDHQEIGALDTLVDGIETTLAGKVRLRTPLRWVFYFYNRELVELYIAYLTYIRQESYRQRKITRLHSQDGKIRLSRKRLEELGHCPDSAGLDNSMSFYQYLLKFNPSYIAGVKTSDSLMSWNPGSLPGGTGFVGGHIRSGHIRNTANGPVYVRAHAVRGHSRRR